MSNDYLNARKEYVERIKKELLGPGSEVCVPDVERELISSSPSVRYSIGILFPQKQCIVRENDDGTDDEKLTEDEFLKAKEILDDEEKKQAEKLFGMEF